MPRRLGWARAVAVALAVGIAAPALGAAADPDPVVLSTGPEDAPTLPPGVSAVAVPERKEEGYAALGRDVSESTLWVGQTVITTPGHLGSLTNRIAPADAVDTRSCGTSGVYADTYAQNLLLTGLMRVDEETCGASSDVVVSTENTGFDQVLAEGTPLQVAVWEEPPARAPSLLPAPGTDVTWRGDVQPARGRARLGRTFADAPELVGGRWDVRVAAGEPGLLRVPLEFGQHVEVTVGYSGPATEDYAAVTTQLLTPLGGQVDWLDDPRNEPTSSEANLMFPGEAGVASPTVAWRNREIADETPAAFPGVYYVNLFLAGKNAPRSGAEVTVGVQVVEDREPEAPYTQEGLPAPDLGGHGEYAAAVAARDRAASSAGDGGSSSDAAGTPWSVVGLLFGGAAVTAVAGGVAWGRWRRSGGW